MHPSVHLIMLKYVITSEEGPRDTTKFNIINNLAMDARTWIKAFFSGKTFSKKGRL